MRMLKLAGTIPALALVGVLGAAPDAQAATLTPGFDGSLLSTETVGARYKGANTGAEHFAGVNDLGQGANRSQAEHTWVAGSATAFSFMFDSATGLIESSLGGASISFQGTAGLVSNVLQLNLSNRVANDPFTFSVSNLSVNGESIADLTCDEFCDWMVTDFAVLPKLTVSGSINLDGTMTGNPNELIRFGVTASSIAPIPLPAAGWLLLTAFGGLGLAAHRRRKAA